MIHIQKSLSHILSIINSVLSYAEVSTTSVAAQTPSERRWWPSTTSLHDKKMRIDFILRRDIKNKSAV